jgi:16S rRNA (guanine966-N2)-methyltransferase
MRALDEWMAEDDGFESAAPVSRNRSRDDQPSGGKYGKRGKEPTGRFGGVKATKRGAGRPGATSKTFEFHVIAGELKGRAIHAPNLGVTRPPLTRVRRAIFDFLEPYIVGQRYLDLFCGTGSYLFEAVSRGAGYCLGVELEKRLTSALESESLRLGVSRRLQFMNADVLKTLPILGDRQQPFDVIMIAPPQYQDLITKTLGVLPDSLLAPNGVVLCQFDPSEKFVADPDRWVTLQERKYGNTIFAVITRKS